MRNNIRVAQYKIYIQVKINTNLRMRELRLELDPMHHIPLTFSTKMSATQAMSLTKAQKYIVQQQLRQRQAIMLREKIRSITDERDKEQSKSRDRFGEVSLQSIKNRSKTRLSKLQQRQKGQKQIQINTEKYRLILQNIQEQKEQAQKQEKYYSYANILISNQKEQETAQRERIKDYSRFYKDIKSKIEDPSKNKLQRNPISYYCNNLPNVGYGRKKNSKRSQSQVQQRAQISQYKNTELNQIIGVKSKTMCKSKKSLRQYKEKNKIEVNLKLREKYIQIAQTTRSSKKMKIFNNEFIKQKLENQEKQKQLSFDIRIKPKLSIKSQPSHQYLNEYGLLVSSKQPSYQYHCQFEDPDKPKSKNNDNKVYLSNFTRRSKEPSQILKDRIKLMLGRRANRVANHPVWQRDKKIERKTIMQKSWQQYKANDSQNQDHQCLSPSSIRKDKLD